jgi:hypothetical protein
LGVAHVGREAHAYGVGLLLVLLCHLLLHDLPSLHLSNALLLIDMVLLLLQHA